VGILGVGTSSPIKVKTPQYRTTSLDIWISTEDGSIVSAKKVRISTLRMKVKVKCFILSKLWNMA
jgi:hypothetical protein